MLTRYFQRNLALIIRYLFAGVLIYLIDMLSFVFAFYLLGINEIFANSFAKIFAGILGFFLHKKITFQVNTLESSTVQQYRYLLLLLLTSVSAIGLFRFILLVIEDLILAKLISDILIVILSFLISKRWVFSTENRK